MKRVLEIHVTKPVRALGRAEAGEADPIIPEVRWGRAAAIPSMSIAAALLVFAAGILPRFANAQQDAPKGLPPLTLSSGEVADLNVGDDYVAVKINTLKPEYTYGVERDGQFLPVELRVSTVMPQDNGVIALMKVVPSENKRLILKGDKVRRYTPPPTPVPTPVAAQDAEGSRFQFKTWPGGAPRGVYRGGAGQDYYTAGSVRVPQAGDSSAAAAPGADTAPSQMAPAGSPGTQASGGVAAPPSSPAGFGAPGSLPAGVSAAGGAAPSSVNPAPASGSPFAGGPASQPAFSVESQPNTFRTLGGQPTAASGANPFGSSSGVAPGVAPAASSPFGSSPVAAAPSAAPTGNPFGSTAPAAAPAASTNPFGSSAPAPAGANPFAPSAAASAAPASSVGKNPLATSAPASAPPAVGASGTNPFAPAGAAPAAPVAASTNPFGPAAGASAAPAAPAAPPANGAVTNPFATGSSVQGGQ